jgi:hypothetical protein
MMDAGNDLGHSLGLSDITNTIQNTPASKAVSENEKTQVDSHHRLLSLDSLRVSHEPSLQVISLPPISNLFEIAGTANSLDRMDAGRTFDNELLTFPSLLWPESPAGLTLPLQLPSPHPLLALRSNQQRDLRTCRTVPLPSISPLHPTFDLNRDQPEESFSKNQQDNSLEIMIYNQSGQLWGLDSTERTQEEPRVYYEETSHLSTGDGLRNPDDQAAFLPPFQPSSSSLCNALSLTFLPPLAPTPRLSTRPSRSRIKNKSPKPLIQCHLCPKAFSSIGMSRHLAWHRRRGDGICLSRLLLFWTIDLLFS